MKKTIRTWFLLVILITTVAAGSACTTGKSLPSTATAVSPITDPAGRLFILSHSAYMDIIDRYHIVGEVMNTSEQYMRFINVAATLYDEAGQIIGAGSIDTFVDILPPGSRTPFNIVFYDQALPAAYKLLIEGSETDSSPLSPLVLLSQSVITRNDGGFNIVGEIRNNRSIEARNVKVIATFYDEEGKVIGAEYSFTEIHQIPSLGTSPFSIMIFDPISYDHYELIVTD
jgi:hypothetical protein